MFKNQTRKAIVLGVIIVILLIVVGILFYRYCENEKYAVQFLNHRNNEGNFYVKGEDAQIVKDIFYFEVEYSEEYLFNEFPQSEEDYTLIYYPRHWREYLFNDASKSPEVDDWDLYFEIQKNPNEFEYIVFGSIKGKKSRHGYIRGNDFHTLNNIINKYIEIDWWLITSFRMKKVHFKILNLFR